MDPVKDFFSDLKSPDPSIRFSVLSRIEDLAWTDVQQQALRELFAQEKDPGIRFHMQKVLARFDTTDKPVVSAGEIEELLKKTDRDEVSLALMLESVKKPQAPLVAISLRESGWPSFSAHLLPSVLKFMKKYGSFEDSADIELLCRHHDPRVLSAAIEALEKLSPDRLKDLIVPLLINSNFGIRSRAVRLLYRWDPSEAVRHFEAMLFSVLESEKQAALFHAFFFPFKEIETLMLRYISVEADAELIKKAGLLFMANPDRQIPARLLEVRQSCTGEKKQLVDSILKGVLQSLYQARIVNAAPEQMLEVLEKHFREKRVRLFIDRYSLGLQSGEAEIRLASALKLCELARHNVVEARELVARFLARERDEKLKKQVELFLHGGNEKTTVVNEPETAGKPTRFVDLALQQRMDYIDSLTAQDFASFFAQISADLAQLPAEQLVAILRQVERFGGIKESEVVVGCLKSDNPEILTAAVDCLSAINPEALHPYLPQLIKHRYDEVKLASIKVFAMFDKKQAISLVEKMLAAIKPAQRRNAIFCLAHFDFHSISQILLTAARNESDADNFLQISSILKSNADEELFFRIFADARNSKPFNRQFYDDLCNEMAGILEAAEPARSREALFADATRKYDEESRIKGQRTAYQLEKIQKIRQHVEKNTVFDASLLRFTIIAYSIGALLTALVWFLFLAPAPESAATVARKTPSRQSSEAITVIGKVVKVDPHDRIVEIQDSQNRRFSFRFVTETGQLPETGKNLHVQLRIIEEKGDLKVAELLTAF
jgi:HEAT repeat protein